MPLQGATAPQAQEAFTLRPGQMILAAQVVPVVPARADRVDLPVDPAGLVARAVPEITVLAVPADLPVDPAGLVARAVPEITVPAARVGPDTPAALVSMVRVALADLVVPADLVGLAAPVVRGTGMPIVATSTTRRGATDLARGDRVSRLGPRGIDRSRLPAARGTTARSTTGAIRKPLCGIPVSTHGASGSSESGSRCK